MTIHTRLAPTPSGFLHIGNAFSFVRTWLLARKNGGTIHLRIDDIDAERARPDYVSDIFETIDWLGLDYDSGPTGVDDFYKNHSQQLRIEQYQSALQHLRQQDILFACTCSRAQMPDGIYKGNCVGKKLDFDAPQTAWRINTATAQPIVFKDIWQGEMQVNIGNSMPFFVVRTKQLRAAYQVVSVMEDLRLGINCIVRGEDLIPSTAAQLFLAQQLPQWQPFLQTQFAHHSLCLDDNGQKLSKSKGSTALCSWRSEGRKPTELFRLFSKWLQLPECSSAQELLAGGGGA